MEKELNDAQRLLRAIFGEDWEEEYEKVKQKRAVNILQIESDIATGISIARVPKEMAEQVAKQLDNCGGLFVNHVMEMNGIIHNDETNKTGMHIVERPSGKILYDVYRQFDSREEDCDIEEELVGTYETEEEAQKVIDNADIDEEIHECYSICDFDPELYYEVLDAEDKPVWGIRFPTLRRAMAFLLHRAKPEAYEAWRNMLKEKRESKEKQG